MSELLQPQQEVQTSSGQTCKVLKYLGGGGQGEVYQASWNQTDWALKWYYQHTATDPQRQALTFLIQEGKPSPKFLWPEELVEHPKIPGFGYLMRLRPPEYCSLTDFVMGKVQPSYYALVTVGLLLTKHLRSLHTKGLCYRDISFGNAFFRPADGDVLICDNDNVTTNKSKDTTILGTPDFMAPEIVRGQALPTTSTDLHSLAVLLFYLFCVGHPLMGRRVLTIHVWDLAARRYLFGKQPLFIFDPQDPANEAVDKAEDPTGETGGTATVYWRLYPEFLRTTFTKAFTTGLHDPDARVTELEWLDTLGALRDALFRCAHCSSPNFYDREALKANGGQPGTCWSCAHPLVLPFRLRLGRAVVLLHAEAKLVAHHFVGDHDFATVQAEVVRHPTDPTIWGLKNLTRANWTVTMADGRQRDVQPGQSVPLASGTVIDFGKVKGEIRY